MTTFALSKEKPHDARAQQDTALTVQVNFISKVKLLN